LHFRDVGVDTALSPLCLLLRIRRASHLLINALAALVETPLFGSCGAIASYQTESIMVTAATTVLQDHKKKGASMVCMRNKSAMAKIAGIRTGND